MKCDEVRSMLELLMDGELDETSARSVQEHLGACEACTTIQREGERLEGILEEAVASMGREEGFSGSPAGVMRQVRQQGHIRRLRWGMVAAASVVVVLAAGYFFSGKKEAPLATLLARYGVASESQREDLEKEIHALGKDAIPAIVTALDHSDIVVQIGAARVLETYRDRLVDELLLKKSARSLPEEENFLAGIGLEDSDRELVQVGFDLFRKGKREDALQLLRNLYRNGINPSVRESTLDQFEELFHSEDPEVRKAAMKLSSDLRVFFPVLRLVALLDVPDPELRDLALKKLRKHSGKDFGTDAGAWRKYLESRPVD